MKFLFVFFVLVAISSARLIGQTNTNYGRTSTNNINQNTRNHGIRYQTPTHTTTQNTNNRNEPWYTTETRDTYRDTPSNTFLDTSEEYTDVDPFRHTNTHATTYGSNRGTNERNTNQGTDRYNDWDTTTTDTRNYNRHTTSRNAQDSTTRGTIVTNGDTNQDTNTRTITRSNPRSNSRHTTTIRRLLTNIYFPLRREEQSTFNLNTHQNRFRNTTVYNIFTDLVEDGLLPQHTPFTRANERHFNEMYYTYRMFINAEDVETVIDFALWCREHLNKHTFYRAFSAAFFQRDDLREQFDFPRAYEVFPEMFFNKRVFELATKINRLYRNDNELDETLNVPGVCTKRNERHIFINGDSRITRPEDRLNYFTHDIEINDMHSSFNTLFPIFDTVENVRNRGEFFYFYHHQLLTKYNLERYSSGLNRTRRLNNNIAVDGFYPYVQIDGIDFPTRPDYTRLTQEGFDLIETSERRLLDAIDGTPLNDATTFNRPQYINELGNAVQGNYEATNANYFNNFWTAAGSVTVGNRHRTYNTATIVETPQTALRDPLFYQFTKRFLGIFTHFQDKFEPYTREELAFDDCNIIAVNVSNLITYTETFDFDITDTLGLPANNEHRFFAHQRRINHVPFTVTTTVECRTSTTADVRLFIAPKSDNRNILTNRQDFFQLDHYRHDFTDRRENVVTRRSIDFTTFVRPNSRVAGLPVRMVLPRGTAEGLPFVLFTIITPVVNTVQDTTTRGFDRFVHNQNTQTRAYETLGYPFNRKIRSGTEFFQNNMQLTDVNIYHYNTIRNELATCTNDGTTYTVTGPTTYADNEITNNRITHTIVTDGLNDDRTSFDTEQIIVTSDPDTTNACNDRYTNTGNTRNTNTHYTRNTDTYNTRNTNTYSTGTTNTYNTRNTNTYNTRNTNTYTTRNTNTYTTPNTYTYNTRNTNTYTTPNTYTYNTRNTNTYTTPNTHTYNTRNPNTYYNRNTNTYTTPNTNTYNTRNTNDEYSTHTEYNRNTFVVNVISRNNVNHRTTYNGNDISTHTTLTGTSTPYGYSSRTQLEQDNDYYVIADNTCDFETNEV